MKLHQPQTRASHTPLRHKKSWKEQVATAKFAWGLLTENELLKINGHHHKLAALIQQRYQVSSEKAQKQVQYFFDNY